MEQKELHLVGVNLEPVGQQECHSLEIQVQNWRWEGPLGTPLGLVHWKRASSPVEAGTAGYL